jgi:sporulation protein YlmC with PRC-barrel domain
MLLTELTKLKVFDVNAKLIGRIQDLDMDPETLTISALILELEDPVSKEFFGSKPLLGKATARGAVDLVQRVGDAVILKSSIEQLKGKLQKL